MSNGHIRRKRMVLLQLQSRLLLVILASPSFRSFLSFVELHFLEYGRLLLRRISLKLGFFSSRGTTYKIGCARGVQQRGSERKNGGFKEVVHCIHVG